MIFGMHIVSNQQNTKKFTKFLNDMYKPYPIKIIIQTLLYLNNTKHLDVDGIALVIDVISNMVKSPVVIKNFI